MRSSRTQVSRKCIDGGEGDENVDGKDEPLPPCSGQVDSFDPEAIRPELDSFYAQLADELAGSLDCPYAVYGFSYGEMPAYCTLIELQRRHARPPLLSVLSSCRPVHCPQVPMFGAAGSAEHGTTGI